MDLKLEDCEKLSSMLRANNYTRNKIGIEFLKETKEWYINGNQFVMSEWMQEGKMGSVYDVYHLILDNQKRMDAPKIVPADYQPNWGTSTYRFTLDDYACRMTYKYHKGREDSSG